MVQVMQSFFFNNFIPKLNIIMFFIIVFQDVKKAILEDMTLKGNEGKLNSFEQVSPFAGRIMHALKKYTS